MPLLLVEVELPSSIVALKYAEACRSMLRLTFQTFGGDHRCLVGGRAGPPPSASKGVLPSVGGWVGSTVDGLATASHAPIQ